MRALTLIRPMDAAIIHLGKNVENRPWAPPSWLIGKCFCIHAGLTWDEGYRESIEKIIAGRTAGAHVDDVIRRSRHTRGAIIGTVKLVRAFDRNPALTRDPLRTSPWYFGPVGWVLEEPFALPEPIPCRGFQKLWRVPPEIAGRILALERHAGIGEAHHAA